MNDVRTMPGNISERANVLVQEIYLDYNATTPVAREVADAMRPLLERHYGNPSSRHWAASHAKEAIAVARAQVAALIGAMPDEIVFTASGTEASNLAIKGVFFALAGQRGQRGHHIITTTIEHPATLEPVRFLERFGATVTRVRVDRAGLVDPDDIRKAITPQTILISVMHANNEVGTIQPIGEIGRIARDHNILFHADAAQSLGKIPVNVSGLGVDLLSIAGHKLYAPKGVGALYVRRGVKLASVIHGAGQEYGLRAGTESALMATGLGAACALAAHIGVPPPGLARSRDLLWEPVQSIFGDGVVLNGHPTLRLPNTLNVSFVGRDGSAILTGLDGIAASTGSACHEGRVSVSPVLAAMGVPESLALGAIRFSTGRDTTEVEIEAAVDRLRHVLDLSKSGSRN